MALVEPQVEASVAQGSTSSNSQGETQSSMEVLDNVSQQSSFRLFKKSIAFYNRCC